MNPHEERRAPSASPLPAIAKPVEGETRSPLADVTGPSAKTGQNTTLPPAASRLADKPEQIRGSIFSDIIRTMRESGKEYLPSHRHREALKEDSNNPELQGSARRFLLSVDRLMLYGSYALTGVALTAGVVGGAFVGGMFTVGIGSVAASCIGMAAFGMAGGGMGMLFSHSAGNWVRSLINHVTPSDIKQQSAWNRLYGGIPEVTKRKRGADDAPTGQADTGTGLGAQGSYGNMNLAKVGLGERFDFDEEH